MACYIMIDLFPSQRFIQTTSKDKIKSPPGGLEPPTFRLTAERASQLRHGGLEVCIKLLYIMYRKINKLYI